MNETKSQHTPAEINDRFKFFLRRGLDERNALGHALCEVPTLAQLRAFADQNCVAYRPSWGGKQLRTAITSALCS